MNTKSRFSATEEQAGGKLADAEIHFIGGDLDGLKLVGFAIWHGETARPHVTFPARQFIVHGERRNFALFARSDDRPRRTVRDSCFARTTSSRGCPPGLRHRRMQRVPIRVQAYALSTRTVATVER